MKKVACCAARCWISRHNLSTLSQNQNQWAATLIHIRALSNYVFVFFFVLFLPSRSTITVVLFIVMIYKREQTTQWVEHGNIGVGPRNGINNLAALFPKVQGLMPSVEWVCVRVFVSVCMYIQYNVKNLQKPSRASSYQGSCSSDIFSVLFLNRFLFLSCHTMDACLSKANKWHCVGPYAWWI